MFKLSIKINVFLLKATFKIFKLSRKTKLICISMLRGPYKQLCLTTRENIELGAGEKRVKSRNLCSYHLENN